MLNLAQVLKHLLRDEHPFQETKHRVHPRMTVRGKRLRKQEKVKVVKQPPKPSLGNEGEK